MSCTRDASRPNGSAEYAVNGYTDGAPNRSTYCGCACSGDKRAAFVVNLGTTYSNLELLEFNSPTDHTAAGAGTIIQLQVDFFVLEDEMEGYDLLSLGVPNDPDNNSILIHSTTVKYELGTTTVHLKNAVTARFVRLSCDNPFGLNAIQVYAMNPLKKCEKGQSEVKTLADLLYGIELIWGADIKLDTTIRELRKMRPILEISALQIHTLTRLQIDIGFHINNFHVAAHITTMQEEATGAYNLLLFFDLPATHRAWDDLFRVCSENKQGRTGINDVPAKMESPWLVFGEHSKIGIPLDSATEDIGTGDDDEEILLEGACSARIPFTSLSDRTKAFLVGLFDETSHADYVLTLEGGVNLLAKMDARFLPTTIRDCLTAKSNISWEELPQAILAGHLGLTTIDWQGSPWVDTDIFHLSATIPSCSTGEPSSAAKPARLDYEIGVDTDTDMDSGDEDADDDKCRYFLGVNAFVADDCCLREQRLC